MVNIVTKIYSIIAKYMHCHVCQLYDLKLLKAGMTNRSYSFLFNKNRYIIRIPGEGTEKLINRYEEYEVYKAIDSFTIGEEVISFDPDTGIKIAKFFENARCCDSNSIEDVQKCMDILRAFHEKKICVKHSFDLWGKIDFYQELRGTVPSIYSDYNSVKENVFRLKPYIESNIRENVLCHVDAVPDNFLFIAAGDENIKIIDWEYAGMQDPDIDIAMFAVYSMYDRNEVDKLIDSYYHNECSTAIRLKIYCYIACVGLLWSNWCEYKKLLGIEFGAYAEHQYKYAQEYVEVFEKAYSSSFGKEYHESFN